jgi:hypothetical protein
VEREPAVIRQTQAPESPEDEKRRLDNRDRFDAEATKWATTLVFTEPLKMIGAIIAQGQSIPGVAPVLTLMMVIQFLGYQHMVLRVQAFGGYKKIKWAERCRILALFLYLIYMFGFIYMFRHQYRWPWNW